MESLAPWIDALAKQLYEPIPEGDIEGRGRRKRLK